MNISEEVVSAAMKSNKVTVLTFEKMLLMKEEKSVVGRDCDAGTISFVGTPAKLHPPPAQAFIPRWAPSSLAT